MERRKTIMNKLLKKIVGAAVGLTMAIGVGFAVGNGVNSLGKADAASAGASPKTIDLTKNQTTSYSDNALNWEYDEFSVVASKESGTKVTNYWPGSGQTQTRLYNNNKITFTPASGYQIDSVTITATSSSYLYVGTTQTATNATISTNDKVATITPTTKTSPVVLTCNNTGRYTAMSVSYSSAVSFGTLDHISLNTTGVKKVFGVGDSFDATGLSITATDTSSVNKNVAYNASGIEYTGYNMSATGTQTVTVSYTLNEVTKSATYTIDVYNKATYVVDTITSLESGSVVAGLTGTYSQTYTTTAEQITGSNSATFTLTPNYKTITLKAIVLNMKSSGSAGSGKVYYTFGGATTYLVGSSDTNVSFANFPGQSAYSSSYKDVTVASGLTINVNSEFTITIAASVSSLYVHNFQLYYLENAKSVTGNKDSVTITADGTSTDTVTFTDWNVASSVTYTASSGNTTVLPNANLAFSSKTLTITAGSTESAGVTVTIRCTDSTNESNYVETTITVILTSLSRNITGLTITAEPSSSAKVFLEGDNFDITGLVVVATFDAAPLSVTYNEASGNLGDLTYEIGNTALTIGSAIPGGVGTGSKTVTVSLEVGNNAELDEYTITVNAKTYATLVNDVSNLWDGQKVFFSSTGATGATTLAEKHAGSNNISETSSEITASGICNETAERGGAYPYMVSRHLIDSTVYYAFSLDVSGTTYYLKDNGSSKSGGGYNNYLQRTTTLDDSCYWTISVTGAGVATITNKSNKSTPVMRYNATNGFFSNYNSGQEDIYLYASYAYDEDTVANKFVDNYMHTDANVTGQCNTYYPLAKKAWNALSDDERLNVSVNHDTAYERLQAWAAAKGDKIDAEHMKLVAKSSSSIMPLTENGSVALIIIVTSSLSLVVLGGFLMMKKRKEQ